MAAETTMTMATIMTTIMPKLFSNHRLVMLLCGAIGFPPPFFRFVFWDAPSGENRRWRRQRASTGISPPSQDKTSSVFWPAAAYSTHL